MLPTPMVLMLTIHSTRVSDLVIADHIITTPPTPLTPYRDGFGNWCSRIVEPPGDIRIFTHALVNDSGLPDGADLFAPQHAVEDFPAETLVFLLGSRYCETDRLTEKVWALFAETPSGWPRVKAICDFVHGHISPLANQHARTPKNALGAFNERMGVCRGYTHLAIAFCRRMNIPARYCTGYLGDIGVPASPDSLDSSAWLEAYLGGRACCSAFTATRRFPKAGRDPGIAEFPIGATGDSPR
jgi:transglutaminase-like putative cysteine protease